MVLFFLRLRTGGKSEEMPIIDKDSTGISSALECLVRYMTTLKRDSPDFKDMFDGICALGVEVGKEVQPMLLPKSDKVLKESTSGKSGFIIFCYTSHHMNCVATLRFI